MGCGNTQKTSAPAPAKPHTSSQESVKYAYGSELDVEAPAHVAQTQPTPVEGPMPTVRIISPKNEAVSKPGQDTMLIVDVKNWDVAPQGKHIHLIIDNEPNIPLFSVSGPIGLKQLYRDTFDKELAPGVHTVRAFPGHPHHESVKSPKAFAFARFFVDTKAPESKPAPKWNARGPLLTYSRPKGCNLVGKPVLLDFFLTHITLADDAAQSGTPSGGAVNYELFAESGEKGPTSIIKGVLRTWQPYLIENLRAGKYVLQLNLVDKDGQPVADPSGGSYNATSRSFSVEDECKKPAVRAH